MVAETDSQLAVLADPGASLPDLMGALSVLGAETGWSSTQRIGISSNVTLNLIDVYLRRYGFLHDVDLHVTIGSFDDFQGDVESFLEAGVEQMFLLPFFDNLLPSFEAQIRHLSNDLVQAKLEETLARLEMVLASGAAFKNIYLGRFHRYTSPTPGTVDRIDTIVRRSNDRLDDLAAAQANVKVIDLHGSIEKIGYEHAFDDRFYARGKAPYKAVALNQIARDLAGVTRGFGSEYYKAIVLDCDNTLWGGVIGEDLLDGIKLDPYDFPGNVFWRIQNEILALERAGALICLCSKNNPDDVTEVMQRHPHMLLNSENISLMKVNWDDKVSNLTAIAEELNIGLDSIVFVDDSDFECQLVRDQLPMVRTFQVPKSLPGYIRVFEDIARLFVDSGSAQPGVSKTQQYRIKKAGEQERARFTSHEDYLRSLDLRVDISCDATHCIPRISELTLKSNQFNLTTKRYSPGEIEQMMRSGDYWVFSFDVEDKFGSCGLTGVLITKRESAVLTIDSFLMSCRVIGRGAEFSVWNTVFAQAQAKGCKMVEASYLPTAKNQQVSDFYDRLGLELVSETADGTKQYTKELAEMEVSSGDWVKVSYV